MSALPARYAVRVWFACAFVVVYRPAEPQAVLDDVSELAGGFEYMCAVLTSGAIDCWGANESGQLGDGSTTDRSIPVHVAVQGSTTSATAGVHHTCAVVDAGLKCWGANYYGQLGDGTQNQHLTPIDVPGLSSGVSQAAVGSAHTCVLVDGGVECWGANQHGQVGSGTVSDFIATPTPVFGLGSGVTGIAAGPDFSCAI
ncbi:MAG TPA: hypothetical protein VGO25_14720, partial [Rhodanobacteraceae bacterium]|nr:hypothetical protein [Rhodanobacteraceae bacterium]